MATAKLVTVEASVSVMDMGYPKQPPVEPLDGPSPPYLKTKILEGVVRSGLLLLWCW